MAKFKRDERVISTIPGFGDKIGRILDEMSGRYAGFYIVEFEDMDLMLNGEHLERIKNGTHEHEQDRL